MKGWGIWKDGHIGIYVGNGKYYTMDSSERNTTYRILSENSFTLIIKLCDVNY